jgi:hypothetical protein
MNLSVRSLGEIASRILAEGGSASIQGLTSRGCFLMLRSKWVLFLTREAPRGPLTVNLAGEDDWLQSLSSRTPVKIRESVLEIGSPAIRLELGKAPRWEPPSRPAKRLTPEDRRGHQVGVCRLLLSQPGDEGSGPLISMLPGLSAVEDIPADPTFPLVEIKYLQTAVRGRDTRQILTTLERFLGRGPGLTPSGDDLVAGFLLALHRWGDLLCPEIDLETLRREVLPLAYRKTSTLAANLVECASQGQGDERLVRALDGMMTGEPGPDECAALLRDYGSSSGRDALLGMLLADARSMGE